MAHHRSIALLLPPLLLCGGCVSTHNDSLMLGRAVELEAFAPRGPDRAPDTTPSLTTIDRSNWTREAFLVPVDGLAHFPTYNTQYRYADWNRRQRQQFPRMTSALDMASGSEVDQVQEAIAAPLGALWDLVLLGPRMIVNAPWRTAHSPRTPYQRLWTSAESDVLDDYDLLTTPGIMGPVR